MKNKILPAVLAAVLTFGNVAYCEQNYQTSQTASDTNIVIVKGKTDSAYSGQDITLMLLKRGTDVEEVTSDELGYVGQSKINSDGTYVFRLKCSDVSLYDVKTNVAGNDVSQSITEVTQECDKYLTNVDFDLYKNNAKARVSVNNVFWLNENMNFYPMIAFYNGNKLLEVKKDDNNAVNSDVTNRTFECNVPEGTTQAKAFVWTDGNQKYIPLCVNNVKDANFHEDYIHTRQPVTASGEETNALTNTFKKINQEKKLNVAFLGGSVTSGVGSSCEWETSWRALVMKWLKETYPDTEFTFCNAAIGGTGSKLAAYRIYHDVLDKMSPDLMFMMHSINDTAIEPNTDEGKEAIRKQVETEIREIQEKNPNVDLVMMYDIDRAYGTNLYNLDQAEPEVNHEFYWTSAIDEELAKHYNLPSINIGKALTSKIGADITDDAIFQEYFNVDSGAYVHPTDKGYAFYFDVIKEFLEEQKYLAKDHLNEELFAKATVEPTGDIFEKSNCYAGDDLDTIVDKDSCQWKRVESFGSYRGYYKTFMEQEETKYELCYPIYYVATAPNQSITYNFTGTGLAVKMSGSNIQYSVDGGTPVVLNGTINTLPVECAKDLEYGNHSVTITKLGNDYNPPEVGDYTDLGYEWYKYTYIDAVMIR